MRIAVLSDLHGNAVGLDACLDDLTAQGGADVIVAAGDLCLDGPRPRKVLERLSSLGIQCVRGNTDRMIALVQADDAEEAAEVAWTRDAIGADWSRWLGDLPHSLRFGEGAAALVVSHANPKNDDEHVWPDASSDQLERLFGDVEGSAFAFGHLHLNYARMWRGKLLVNVASAGLPKDGDPRLHYAIFTQRDDGWQVKSRRVDFDIDKVAKQLRKSGMPAAHKRIDVLRRHRYKQLGEIIP
jgi:putative phosphoesterase